MSSIYKSRSLDDPMLDPSTNDALTPTASATSNLTRISDRYQALLLLQKERATSSPAMTEAERERRASVLGDAMLQMAWKMTDIPAHDLIEARAKAVVLLDWVGHEKGDVSDQLAASLARDIMMLFTDSSPKE
jgi:hypothetical protein